jgi:hypothetical protein
VRCSILRRWMPIARNRSWPIDGNFGPRTESFVRAYQPSAIIGAGGIVGDRTWWSPAGDGGRDPRVDSWPRHGLVERAGLAAVVLSLLSFASGVVLPVGGAAASPLPRMTGRPSLPVPITMTFEFVDCES